MRSQGLRLLGKLARSANNENSLTFLPSCRQGLVAASTSGRDGSDAAACNTRTRFNAVFEQLRWQANTARESEPASDGEGEFINPTVFPSMPPSAGTVAVYQKFQMQSLLENSKRLKLPVKAYHIGRSSFCFFCGLCMHTPVGTDLVGGHLAPHACNPVGQTPCWHLIFAFTDT